MASSSITSLSEAEVTALGDQIFVDVERRLAKKEDALWRRGRHEIRKLQVEQENIKGSLSQMLETQAVLEKESRSMTDALLSVTAKIESVATEMRDVLRALPHLNTQKDRPSLQKGGHGSEQPPGVVSKAGGKHSLRDTCGDTPALESVDPLGFGERQSDVDPLIREGGKENLAEPRPFQTPLRESMPLASFGTVDDAMSQALNELVMTPSPAVLSLASVLPSVPGASSSVCIRDGLTTSSSTVAASGACGVDATPQNPTPPFKRMQSTQCHQGQEVCGSAAVPMLPSVTSTAERISCSGTLPDLFSVELVKDPANPTLGIDVNQADGTSLQVAAIDQYGTVAIHNASQDFEWRKIHVGDRITEVNGIRHDPDRMLQECKFQHRLTLALSRGEVVTGSASTAALASPAVMSSPAMPGFAHMVGNDSSMTNFPTTAIEQMQDAARRLRPDAQVFVPSAQREQVTGLTNIAAVPGVHHLAAPPGLPFLPPPAGVAGQQAVTQPQPPLDHLLLTRPPTPCWGTAEADDEAGPEVKRTLFE